ncbi:hypothetical protein SRHO_G00115300 [Serrasalmus rhombeus]
MRRSKTALQFFPATGSSPSHRSQRDSRSLPSKQSLPNLEHIGWRSCSVAFRKGLTVFYLLCRVMLQWCQKWNCPGVA